jgi:radical SAM superfamily enzyme YgiQ (UPF0313 family)
MSLRIKLIFARADLRRGTRIKHFMVPPLGLQILSALTPAQHQVSIVDEYHKPASRNLQADLIGISVWTASSGRAYALADHYRSRGIPVVLGGPHVSVCPQEAGAHADAVVAGEAESVWAQVLQDAEAGCLKPRYQGLNQPLNRVPAPDWKAIRTNDYAIQAAPSTSRGCVRSCDFCYESCRPKPNFRQRPLELVLREIDERPGAVIAFLDNDISANRPFARQLFAALSRRNRRWLGMTSIETANDLALLDLMAQSGCRSLFVGFETINPQNLDQVGKHCNKVADYARNVRRIHERGIMVNGSFVFGFDGDDVGVFDRTVDFGLEACLDSATFTVLTPYPGTTLYKRLEAQGRIVDRDWSHYDTTRVVFKPALMSAQELEAGYCRAYRRFYSWPSIVKRCRPADAGFSKRLFLNIAYKRVEPLYQLLGRPVPVGWLRPLFNWYARPFGATPAHSQRAPASYGAAARSEHDTSI